MYDVEKLVSVVCDYLDAEADYKKYSLDVRKELGLAPDSPPVDSFPQWLQGIPPGRAVRKVRSDREHFGRHLRHAGHQSGIAGGRCQIHATQGTP